MSTGSSSGTAISTTSTTSVSGFTTLGDYLEEWRPQIGGRSGINDKMLIQFMNDGIADMSNAIPSDDLIIEQSISVTVAGGDTYSFDSGTYRYRDLILNSWTITDSASSVSIPGYVPYSSWEAFKVSHTVGSSQLTTTAKTYFTVLPKASSARRLIELFPDPTASVTFKLWYTYFPGVLAEGQESTTIPLPPEWRSVLNQYILFRVYGFTGRVQGQLQFQRNLYDQALGALAHSKATSNIGKAGIVQTDYSGPIRDPIDYSGFD